MSRSVELMFLLCQCWLACVLSETLSCCFENNTKDFEEGLPTRHRQIIQLKSMMEFPPSSTGLSRRKRDWVIPPISFPENDRGPYPKVMVQIKSSKDKKVSVTYRISGPGADEPPEGLFTVDKRSGTMFVTQSLDREKQAEYKLWAHALSVGAKAEEPMELIIRVIDQNDNRPEFTHNPFHGSVSESTDVDHSFMRITALDRDDPDTENSVVRYRIRGQTPGKPAPHMFAINPVSGVIRVVSTGLDRETHPEYSLLIEAADMEGEGLTATCTAIITLIDSNDHAPQFTMTTLSSSVPENEVGLVVAKLQATDLDEPGAPTATTRYSIVKGNEGGYFGVSTGPSKMEGIITTVKELDYESGPVFTLLVVVENEAAFSGPVSVSTATVTVRVEDRNEAPVFAPAERTVSRPEDAAVGSSVADCSATDPDTARTQSVRYQLTQDSARWLSINKDSGLVTVKRRMDREASALVNDKYTVLILAYDNDTVPATGTGTLVVELLDVNDHAPALRQRRVTLCREAPPPTLLAPPPEATPPEATPPALLDILDPDGPGNAGPFTAELQGEHRNNWTVSTNYSTVTLSPRRVLPLGEYQVLMRVYDAQMLYQDSVLTAEVCQCRGSASSSSACFAPPPSARLLDTPPHVLAVRALGAILGALLLLLLLLLLRKRRRGSETTDTLLPEEDVRDNIYYYSEEGGGEEDQEYDLRQLHRGLDGRPEVFCTDEAPPPPAVPPLAQYRLRPQENEDIGTFIQDNLRVADGDPAAPPYDCLLVFDYEGRGSASSGATSLSSLCSCGSEEEQDYQRLAGWGPRFSRLAQLYTEGEDRDTLEDSDILPGKCEWV